MEYINRMHRDNESVTEEFCTSCMGAGLAVVGAGTTTAGSLVRNNHKVWKQVLLWSGVGICVLAFILLIMGYFV